jgi:crotonobetaine/carnitine-CoA ligase
MSTPTASNASSTLVPATHAPTIHPFAGLDFNWLLDARSAAAPDKTFLTWEPFTRADGGEGQTARYSYAEFRDHTLATARALVAQGVKPGDTVLIHLDNCPEFLFAWCACARVGAIAVTTNTRSAADELAYFASHSGAVGVISQTGLAKRLPLGADSTLGWCVLLADIGQAQDVPTQLPAHLSWGQFIAQGQGQDLPQLAADPERSISVQYTSGTTSRPKGVLFTHANALFSGRQNALHEALQPDDVHFIQMPLFHLNALGYSFLAALWVGAAIVLQPRFSASRFWPVAVRNRCTWGSMVPFCMRAIAAQGPAPQHHFRAWGMGARDVPMALEMGVQTVSWYGMTETISHVVVSMPGLPSPMGSIGWPSPVYEVVVLNDDGTPTPVGETGHLRVRGRRGVSLFKEYLKNPEATANSFDEHGFFITGDRVTLLPGGCLQFGDRDKDMLKVGGENVAASEIERVLATVPGVAEAAVVAKKDPLRDEVPVAFVLSDAPPAEHASLIERVLATCRAKLADFKVPVQVIVVDELPRGTLEKVSKVTLRQRLEG